MPTKAWRALMSAGQQTGISQMMDMPTPRRLLLLVLLLMWWSSSLHVSFVMARSRSKSGLELWIDDRQVKALAGMDMKIPIIEGGAVIEYLKEIDLGEHLIIPSEVDTVNLTWQAGNQLYTYEFDKFVSLDQSLLYQPLLGIPVRGTIPKYPQVFQITIPCKGTEGGVASLSLGLKIFDRWHHLLKNTPIEFKLKKRCITFATTSHCRYECQNGGTCNDMGDCDCPTGFDGDMCEVAQCTPGCQNNGTCISPSNCLCLAGFYGQYCEKGRAHGQALSSGALASPCGQPCQNGGHCLPEAFCWCATGFFGDACEYSQCNPHCKNGGTCIGRNFCQCTDDFTGTLCERPLTPIREESDRSRRSRMDSKTTVTTRAPKNKTKPKRRPRTIKNLEQKLRKAEQRLLRITLRRSQKWDVSHQERRRLRSLKRSADKKPLSLKERRELIKVMTRERKHLTSKDKKKLKRFKHLIRQAKARRKKQKKPRKRRVYV